MRGPTVKLHATFRLCNPCCYKSTALVNLWQSQYNPALMCYVGSKTSNYVFCRVPLSEDYWNDLGNRLHLADGEFLGSSCRVCWPIWKAGPGEYYKCGWSSPRHGPYSPLNWQETHPSPAADAGHIISKWAWLAFHCIYNLVKRQRDVVLFNLLQILMWQMILRREELRPPATSPSKAAHTRSVACVSTFILNPHTSWLSSCL